MPFIESTSKSPDNITMKDIFWTDLLKFFFELKSKENIQITNKNKI
jgi:hypothetical protein